MSFGEAVQAGFRNYVKFSGRASVQEFWYWVLFTIVGGLVAAVLDVLFFLSATSNTPLSDIFGLVILLPGIAVAIRRLHDTDRSGWWYLLWFIPLVGIIILIIWWIQRGTPGDNRFGPPASAGAGS
jgi:uncharacterized membrane protein YhaH (DUF805 family)